MVKFQNCSAPNTGDAGALATEGSGPGFIDDLVNQKLAFVESLIVTQHDKGTINFDGLCDRESHGKAVQWVIEDVSTRDVVLEGNSECIRGGFRVTADQMNDLDCGVDYDLVAAVDEDYDNVIVRKKCEPMAVVADEAIETSGYQKQCYFELEDEANKSESVCYHVCYGSGKLYSRVEEHPSKCGK